MLHPLCVLFGKLGCEVVVGYAFGISQSQRIVTHGRGGVADGLSPLPHLQAWKIADSLSHRHGWEQAVLVRVGETESQHPAAAPEVCPAGCDSAWAREARFR